MAADYHSGGDDIFAEDDSVGSAMFAEEEDDAVGDAMFAEDTEESESSGTKCFLWRGGESPPNTVAVDQPWESEYLNAEKLIDSEKTNAFFVIIHSAIKLKGVS